MRGGDNSGVACAIGYQKDILRRCWRVMVKSCISYIGQFEWVSMVKSSFEAGYASSSLLVSVDLINAISIL